MAVSLFRIFQRLSLYDLTGFFFIKFIIQLSLLPFGLPRCKLSLSFFGFKVGLNKTYLYEIIVACFKYLYA